MTHDQATYWDMLDELLEIEDGLTRWEVNFVDDLDRFREDSPAPQLSQKQCMKIAQLWDKHCA